MCGQGVGRQAGRAGDVLSPPLPVRPAPVGPTTMAMSMVASWPAPSRATMAGAALHPMLPIARAATTEPRTPGSAPGDLHQERPPATRRVRVTNQDENGDDSAMHVSMRDLVAVSECHCADVRPEVVQSVPGALKPFAPLPTPIRPSPRPPPPADDPAPPASLLAPARSPPPHCPAGVYVSWNVEGSSSRDTHTASRRIVGASGVPPPNLEGSKRLGTPGATSSPSSWIYGSAGVARDRAVHDTYVHRHLVTAVARPSNDVLPADQSAPRSSSAFVSDEHDGADSPVDVCDDHGGSRSSQAHRSTCRPALLTPTAAWSAKSASASLLRVPT